MVTIGSTTLGPLQLCALGFLAVVTFIALMMTGRGKKIPIPVQGLIAGGMILVTITIMKSFAEPKPDTSVDDEANYFEKKKDRKERKRAKKVDAKADAESELERVRAEKKAVKLAEKKALKQIEAEKKAAEVKAEQPKAEEEEKGEKKKKKKKKKKDKKPAEAVSTAEEPVKVEAPDAQGWVTKPNKKEAYAAKKAAMGGNGPITTGEMMVNPRHYPSIVGAGGAISKRIQELYEVEMKLPRRGNEDDTHIKFTGPEANIEIVKMIVHEIIDKGYSKTMDGNLSDVVLEVTNLGLLIGPGGCNIRAIQAKTNTRINLPEKEGREKNDTKEKGKRAPSKPVTVTILGDTRDVAVAVNAITMLLEKGYSDLTHDNYTEGEVAFPQSMIGILKGVKGESIQLLQKQTNTRINVPDLSDEASKNSPLVSITVVGPAEGVEQARQAMITLQRDHVTREFDINALFVPLFKGSAGVNIIRIKKASNCRIDVGAHCWDPSLQTVTVSGLAKNISMVEQEVVMINQTNTQWQFDMPVDRAKKMFLNKGQFLKDLQAKTGTRVNVRDHEWDDLVRDVTAVGSVEGVQVARMELENFMKPEPAPEPVAAPTTEEPVQQE